jgi:hypothetical protein
MTETLIYVCARYAPPGAFRIIGPREAVAQVVRVWAQSPMAKRVKDAWWATSARWRPPLQGPAPALALGRHAARGCGIVSTIRPGIWTRPEPPWVAWLALPVGPAGIGQVLRAMPLDMDVDFAVGFGP